MVEPIAGLFGAVAVVVRILYNIPIMCQLDVKIQILVSVYFLMIIFFYNNSVVYHPVLFLQNGMHKSELVFSQEIVQGKLRYRCIILYMLVC